MRRFLSVAAACATCLLLAGALPARAQQAWPSKPVHWLVPFPPGGASDITARVLAEQLSRLWGQAVLIENRPGAGGTIATAEMTRAPGDGYTIMSGTMGTHAIAPNLYKNLSYDPVKDLIPVSMVADVPLVLVASLKLEPSTLKDFVTLARQKPGTFAYASPGNGTLNHLMGELFKRAAGLDMVHIPYKNGAYPDMYSGAVSLLFDPILGASIQVKQGKLKALAIAAGKRSPALPDVPTMAELGYPGFDATLWLGIFAPAGTPAPVIAKLNADLVRTLRLPEVKARLEELGGEVVGSGQEEFALRHRNDVARWGRIIREMGVKID